MKKSYLIAFVGLVVVSVIIPLLLNTSNEDAIHIIDHISFIIAAVCGIITTIIAILLYDKYGVDKKIVDKNLEVVLQFVDELKKTRIIIKSEGKSDGRYTMFIDFKFKELGKQNFLSENRHDKLYFKLDYCYGLNNLFEICMNPFMPSEICDKFNKISMTSLSKITEEDKQVDYAVALCPSSFHELDDKDNYIGKLNRHDFTVGEFIDDYVAVKDAIKKWLKAHNVDDSSLNF